MADRLGYQDGADFHPRTAFINLQFTAGASGAVPARTATGSRFAGIASVVLTATGIYTVTFQDTWYSVIAVDSGVYQVTYTPAHCGQFYSKPAEVTGSSVVLRGITTDGAGTAVAMTSGDVMWAIFKVSKGPGNG